MALLNDRFNRERPIMTKLDDYTTHIENYLSTLEDKHPDAIGSAINIARTHQSQFKPSAQQYKQLASFIDKLAKRNKLLRKEPNVEHARTDEEGT